MPQIEVTFDIDAHGIVHVSAKDKASGKEQVIRIQSSGGLTDSEIQNMIKEAESKAEEDEKRKKFVEVKNNAENLVHSTEKSLKEHGDKISNADKLDIENAIRDVKDCISKDNIEDADNFYAK